MNQLPVQRASELSVDSASLTQWLVQGLWSDQAVGILGGEPKCCKSFLALDLAVSVASGTPCLRRFAVRRTGPVLLFPAEDSLAVVRQRLEGICSAAGVDFQSLPVEVITAPTLRLDAPKDRERLTNTVQARQPRLLILDPLIRLHRVDENDASQIAGLLSYLRLLQRTFQVAVLVVHHARKDANSTRPGQALRGSSELHGWGDSNLYMRRRGAQLTLSTEHRAAASQDHIPLELTQAGSALALSVASDSATIPDPGSEPSALQRIQQVLAGLDQPVTVQQLRKLCGLRTATVCSCLAQLTLAIISRFPFPAYRPPGKRKRETLPLTTLRRRSEQPQFASAEDRATLGSDPSADWSPANGRSGGFHTKAARLAHCRCREQSDKSIPLFHRPPDGTHNWHLTATIKIPPNRRFNCY